MALFGAGFNITKQFGAGVMILGRTLGLFDDDNTSDHAARLGTENRDNETAPVERCLEWHSNCPVDC